MPFTAKGIKKLAAHHGLDPEKDDDSMIDDCLKNSLSDDDEEEMANRIIAGDAAVKELETIRNSRVDSDLKAYANRIGDSEESKAFWRPQLLANRDNTIKVIEKMPAAESKSKGGKEPLHNRESAGQPGDLNGQGSAKKGRDKNAVAIRNRATELQNSARNLGQTLSFSQAFRQAQTESAAE